MNTIANHFTARLGRRVANRFDVCRAAHFDTRRSAHCVARIATCVVTVSLLALLALAPIGCTQQSDNSTQTASGVDAAAATSTNSYVISRDTLLYKNGPAQPMPPDATLRAGTTVTKLKRLGNYTLVQTSDGTKGYVATADISLGQH